MTVPPENRVSNGGVLADPGVGPDDRALDVRVLLDMALPPDDAVRADSRAALDDRALVDEARTFDNRPFTLTASINGKLVGSSARRVRVRLGSHAFSIAAGRTRTVEVDLTARGFALLVRVKRLPTRVRISYKQPAGDTTAATRTITLTAPKSVTR